MVWVPIHQRLIDGPEMARWERITGRPPMLLLGHMVALWLWATTFAEDGLLPDDHFTIAKAARWLDDPAQLVDELIACKLIVPNDDGTFTLAHYDEMMVPYQEKAETTRRRTKERVRLHRERRKAERDREKREREGQEGDVTVTEALHPVTVTDVTRHNTIQNNTTQNNTEDRALRAEQGARDNPARFISDDAKLRAFAEYRPTDDDRKWAAKNAPSVALDAELENLGEWCRLNRTKIVSDYNSPKDFWRRWMRRAVEKQRGNNGRSTYAEQRLSLGEVPAPSEPEDSRERLRSRRVAN